MGRAIALIILLIPIIGSGYGIKLMRDAIFQEVLAPYPTLGLQFAFGMIFFLVGLAFVAGFIFHRDRKRGKVAPKWRENKTKQT
ncbi:DUF2627 domain-containing protein [Shouchella shacheensis]|uniref:DUF2627 domain-containing protein n=1 Tax=Shouchella shacheensis TaxID=1649580 RepID=UPI0007400518|nr:DUF2627 domain-containing protein [Shouchella shacheensis]